MGSEVTELLLKFKSLKYLMPVLFFRDNYDELVPAQHIRTIRTFRLFGLELMECKAGLENQIIDEYQTASCYHLSTYERRNVCALL